MAPARTTRLLEDVDRGSDAGPLPRELGLVQTDAKTSVRATIAPIRAPVVVVNAGAVSGEVLRVQHVVEVVPARRSARNRRNHALAGHRFVCQTRLDEVRPERGSIR